VLLAQSVDLASKAERLRLSLYKSDRVLHSTWLTQVAGRSSLYQQAALPLARVPGLKPDDVVPHNLLDLGREFGLVLGRAIEFVSFETGDEMVCSQLGVPDGAKLLRLDRITHTRDGVPLEWRVSYMFPEAD
jgi:DNA-binding GntR family transcriptional regulator